MGAKHWQPGPVRPTDSYLGLGIDRIYSPEKREIKCEKALQMTEITKLP
jgi:hypothetical protein